MLELTPESRGSTPSRDTVVKLCSVYPTQVGGPPVRIRTDLVANLVPRTSGGLPVLFSRTGARRWLPRTGGDLPVPDLTQMAPNLFAPQPRGSTRKLHLGKLLPTFCPAPAGIYPRGDHGPDAALRLPPHKRGSPQFEPCSGVVATGYPAQKRGSTFPTTLRGFPIHVCPAPAGVVHVKPQLFTDTFQILKPGSDAKAHLRSDGSFDRRAYAYAYTLMDRKRRKANGTCKGCPEPAIPGQLRCTTCAEQHRGKGLASRERLKGSPKDYALRENRSSRGAETRKRHKKLGRCVRCPNPSIPGETLCTTCRKNHQEQNRAYRRNHKAQSTQPLTEGNTFQQTFELTKPKKATKPNLRKPTAESPRVTTKAIKEPIEFRREYDRTREQTDERKEFQRRYKKQIRQERKAAGLCKTCHNPAIPGQTRCEACRDKHNRNR